MRASRAIPSGSVAACPAGSASRCTWSRSDRKSTRLNSSHLVISYAVFCLKKKKKTRQIRAITNINEKVAAPNHSRIGDLSHDLLTRLNRSKSPLLSVDIITACSDHRYHGY